MQDFASRVTAVQPAAPFVIGNLVTELEEAGEDGREMRGFETLTLAPIDLGLVEPALLTPEEIDWLDAYHARVRTAHRDSLDPAEAAWLEQATRPLAG
jgi:Xaa-Pro aminopeptidase